MSEFPNRATESLILEVVAVAPIRAKSISNYTNNNPSRAAAPEGTTTATHVINTARVTAILVSGVDLTEYMRPPSQDTPFERFLKDENRLEKLATSPWISRVHKL